MREPRTIQQALNCYYRFDGVEKRVGDIWTIRMYKHIRQYGEKEYIYFTKTQKYLEREYPSFLKEYI